MNDRHRKDAPGAGDKLERRRLLERLLRERAGLDEPVPAGGETAPETRFAPLSFAQERLWLLDQFDPDSHAYNLPTAFRISGPLDAAVLQRSLRRVIERHETLRTTFLARDDGPVQRISPAVSALVPVIDLSHLPAPDREVELGRECTEDAKRPFDLSRGPLFRARLFRLAESDHVLLLVMHHIICDGWSMGVLRHELATIYEALHQGTLAQLAELPVQYAEFASAQRDYLRGEALDRQLAYWKDRLEHYAPDTGLPTDRPRPPIRTIGGARRAFNLSPATWESLKALGRRERCTPFMTLLAAFMTLLHRYSGQEDVIVGTPVANRKQPEFESLIGFFVNTLVMRADLAQDPSFSELLVRVRKAALDAYEHMDLPFERLVEAVNPPRDLSRTPIFQVLFSLQNAPSPTADPSGLTWAPLNVYNETSKFDLSVYTWEGPEGLYGTFEYSTDLFETATVDRMIEHFGVLLGSLAADPGQRLSAIRIMPDAEREQVLFEWNETSLPCPQACMDELLAAQAARTPDAVALVFEGQRLSYRQLDRRAARLAHRLRDLGVGPEVLVGVYLERSVEMVVALLGVLKAGGAYVPLDPHHPVERTGFVLQDAAVSVLLTMPDLAAGLPPIQADIVCLDRHAESAEMIPTADLPVTRCPEHLAYVIYTSGSTGRPKGVAVTHRSLVNFIASMAGEPGIARSDVLLSVTTLSFDIFGLELYLPLAAGARVVLAGQEAVSDPRTLIDLVDASGATAMQATPATWRMLVDADWKGSAQLKALCGGEALPLELADQLRGRVASLWNLYGPTETTIWSSLGPITGRDSFVPLGHPVANTRLYVLDGTLQPVPVGIPGELYIAGKGLARCYLNRPDLTAERFRPDPFGAEPGERLYATGDMVRRRADGRLEFLGRADNQVKLRGFRVELGEIEELLLQHPAIGEAVVLVREDVPGDQRLVGYVVPAPGPGGVAADREDRELSQYLAEKLPDYMVPRTFVTLATLPLTPNGKIDRRALPAPDTTRRGQYDGFREPKTPLEVGMARIWSDVIGLDAVGVQDNFFDLGGHSLLAVRAVARCEKDLGVRINPRELVYQTLGQLAASRENAVGQAAVREPSPEGVGSELDLFFFGPEDTQLFGCYHQPGTRRKRERVIVLCPPTGDEYIRFHRSLQQLAGRLSRLGFPVLRFDYFGCGDSAGDSEDGRPSRWRNDISAAIEEAKRRSGLGRVCLIGLRLGGSLAVETASGRSDVDCLVLWDPVRNGEEYVAELLTAHRAMLRKAHVRPGPRSRRDSTQEILGFALTPDMRADLKMLDLLSTRQPPADRVLLLESNDKVNQDALRHHIGDLGAAVEYRKLHTPQFWTWMEDFGGIVVPGQILDLFASWMTEVPE